MTIPLELLAPAKTADFGMAAIDHGADAVYIGAPKFSARAEAGNELADIRRLIRHAHLYSAKVYAALNTILTDVELPLARDIIHELHDMGADGLILQDVGLLELDLPPIPLIASTQMHNDSVEKVKFLESVGFRRVILARELSLEDIAAIRRDTTVELESFVHGALCVSYSGQCYMSQAVAKRSGNRGVCAQPCRSRYTLTDGDGETVLDRKFPLSLKDLNLSARIPDLVAAGITSFKIEGRLKDIDYVKNTVAAYRAAIDGFLAAHPAYGRASSGRSTIAFIPDLGRTFHRGYTGYFIDGRTEKIASLDTQKAMGQPMGKVIEVGKDSFRLDGEALENGDGLCFFTRERELVGFRADRVEGDRIYPNVEKGPKAKKGPNPLRALRVGTRIFRNHDHAFSQALKKNTATRRIDVEIRFRQDADGLHIEITDEDGQQSRHDEPMEFVPAKDPERMRSQIVAHLSRTGDTPYAVTKVLIDSDTSGFIPLSLLNDLRRKTLEEHTRRRLDAFAARTEAQSRPLVPNDAPYPETELGFTANILNEHARRFYRRHGVQTLAPGFETLDDPTGKTVMTTRYCLRHQLDACLKLAGKEGRLKEPLRIDDGRHRYRLEFDCAHCRMRVVLEGRSPVTPPS